MRNILHGMYTRWRKIQECWSILTLRLGLSWGCEICPVQWEQNVQCLVLLCCTFWPSELSRNHVTAKTKIESFQVDSPHWPPHLAHAIIEKIHIDFSNIEIRKVPFSTDCHVCDVWDLRNSRFALRSHGENNVLDYLGNKPMLRFNGYLRAEYKIGL